MPQAGLPSKENVMLGIFGTGGFARQVMPIARSAFANGLSWGNNNAKVDPVFVETEPHASSVNGHPIISEKEFVDYAHPRKYFSVAIANHIQRQEIVRRCQQAGIKPLNVISPSFVMLDENEIGTGVIICAHVMITSNVKIGNFFHANNYSFVAHDCVIGDYVTFAPRVTCNGNIHIEDHAYVGAGAVIKQGGNHKKLVIGKGAVVGMGAVVTKDVPAGVTVVGNPARPLAR